LDIEHCCASCLQVIFSKGYAFHRWPALLIQGTSTVPKLRFGFQETGIDAYRHRSHLWSPGERF